MGLFGKRAREDAPVEVSAEAATVASHVTSFLDLAAERASFNLGRAPASTDLNAHDVYLLQQAGYEFVQVVFGNIVYSMGLKGVLRSLQRAFVRGEMVEFTAMLNDAREIARNRMLREAAALGANAVVHVSLSTEEYADFLEVTAVGTAVRRRANVPTTRPDVTVSA